MSTDIYLSGGKTNQGTLNLPLNSCAVIFTIKYCQLNNVTLHFVSKSKSDNLISLQSKVVNELNVYYLIPNKVPDSVRMCTLPVMVSGEGNLIRSGLCSVLRQIICIAHNCYPSESYNDLLGFRGGSLKACAEVSSWTKLCELEFPEAMMTAIQEIRSLRAKADFDKTEKHGITYTLPKEAIVLESHMHQPPRIHNDDKMKRYLIQCLINNWSSEEDISKLENNVYAKLCQGYNPLVGEMIQSHAIIRFRLEGLNENTDNQNELQQNRNKPFEDDLLLAQLAEKMKKMKLDDVFLDHLYVEGIEMTIADLILFIFVYHFLESVDLQLGLLITHLPKLGAWFQHMSNMPRMRVAASEYGCNLNDLCLTLGNDNHSSLLINKFALSEIAEEDNKESELQRRTRSKYRALKPELAKVLKLIKTAGIQPKGGEHPCGTNIELPWSTLPAAVHPQEGGLPAKRALKKCQQLENIVTAVKEIVTKGQIIVDFCSGGGHLGITLASLIPYCQVYLIENKEESLHIAKSRVDKLGLKNITLYQCNLGYFHGKFDLGTCLHACGVATDMVLQKCINSEAAFVVCPCCYGAVQNTHLITYPRSQLFQAANISDMDLLTLGHAADQTEFKIALAEQGRYCMNLVDTDRLAYTEEKGYDVILCSLQPLTCTPKNNLLIGTPKYIKNGLS